MKPRIVLSCLLLISCVFAGPAFAAEAPAVSEPLDAHTAVEPTALEPADDRAEARPSPYRVAGHAGPFGMPVFVDTPGACLGSDAPTPLGAAGLMGCPYGPTCYGDAQCATVCGALGSGVCGPDFCCWCIAG